MKRLSLKSFLCLTLLALVVTGCNRQTALVPPKIHYGLETCADCGMIINDPHYAAALVWRATPNGPTQTAVFDDIGCLLSWRRHHAGVQVAALWVKDVRTEAWLDAKSAIYVKSRHLQTPMGWGIVAGTAPDDFLALSVQKNLLTWTDLLNTGGPETDASTPNSHNKN